MKDIERTGTLKRWKGWSPYFQGAQRSQDFLHGHIILTTVWWGSWYHWVFRFHFSCHDKSNFRGKVVYLVSNSRSWSTIERRKIGRSNQGFEVSMALLQFQKCYHQQGNLPHSSGSVAGSWGMLLTSLLTGLSSSNIFYIVQEHLPRKWCLLQWSESSIDTFTGQSDLSNSLEELEVLLSSDSRLCKVDSKN